MSNLRQTVNDYLEIRRSLGYKLVQTGRLLNDFVTYLEDSGSSFIKEKVVLEWASNPANITPYTQACRLAAVRLFARYVYALDPRTEVPRKGLIPFRQNRNAPYFYSDEEVKALMRAALELPGLLMPYTYANLIGLLAVTGMRVGEAIALDRADLNERERLLVIRNAKFGKTREVHLHATTLHALKKYARKRDQVFALSGSTSFFVSSAGTRLHRQNVSVIFVRLLEKAGLASEPRCRPRIHDLRHSFAINTLMGWYKAGLDVESRLPLLSTYLGHVSPSSTYWYLTAVPELVCLAAGRLEKHMGDLP